MPTDIDAILERVEEELGEEARATLEAALGMDSGRSGRSGTELPEDVEEAKDGELKASEKMGTGGYAGAIQAEFTPEERPDRAPQGENPLATGKMDTGRIDPDPVDYTDEIADTFGSDD